MTGTIVAYHVEAFEHGRPAINVKVRARFHDDPAYRRTYEAIAGNPLADADALAEQAWDYIARRFWDDAANKSDALGLGRIEQQGRSGGWLVLIDGHDPQDMGPAERRDWLARYSALVEWCERQIAAAPIETARVLQAYAADAAVAP